MICVRESSALGEMIFFGEYLMDLDTLPDVNGPFPIQLTFTDGVGKLRETNFESENVSATQDSYYIAGHQPFNFWIGQILQHTGFYKNTVSSRGFWDDASNTLAFSTCVRWYNSEMYYTPDSTNILSDVLQQTSAN